jgi:2,3-diketo-5-methylthiopentyl-1-phosphate enolase
MTFNTEDFVVATYLVHDHREKLQTRAEGIAVGLTVGSWTDLPLVKQQEIQKHCGQVAGIEVVGEAENGLVKAHISILYPVINFTASIPALLTTVFGKLSMDGKIRLVGLELPASFVRNFPGPKFGVEGIRKQLGVYGRPFLMSIFKSCIGSSLSDLETYFREQAQGGVDFIKDDEIFFTEAYATPEKRVEAFSRIAEEVGRETGRKIRYAVNLTGPTSQIFERARRLSECGAGALLLNVFAYGYDVLQELASDSRVTVPIMAHPAISGALYASPEYGISSHIVLGQLTRLAGADIVLYPSAYGSVTLAAEEGTALVEELRKDNGLKQVLPAPSAGVHPGLVPTLIRDLGMDFIVNAGGGIHGHPEGPTAGGRAFVAAIEAAVAGKPLREAAKDSPELQKAIEKWGVREA